MEQYLFEARVELPSFLIKVNLYVAALGSYDVILGMNWLWKHRVKVDCHAKSVEFLDDLGNWVSIQGIPREAKLRQITVIKNA